MPETRPRHVIVVALEVTDRDAYARYRTLMTPILESYGGAFGYDFEVGQVLQAETSDRINRVFTLSFPDRTTRERFFSDPGYLMVRSGWFERAVASITILAEADKPQ